ncbi:MAG: hypothetical protein R3E65_03550 [Steroidobacteraceae bacterium]
MSSEGLVTVRHLLCSALLLASATVSAQQAGNPPPPDPVSQPAAPAATPAEEIEPRVDTSAAAPTPTNTTPAAPAAPARGAASSPPRPARAQGRAQDRVDLDATQITGNRELPRVLYIVPWKRSDLGDLTGKPVNSLLDEVLAPVDRDVFRRETRYFDEVAAAPGPGGGATPGGDSVRDGSQAPEPGGQ